MSDDIEHGPFLPHCWADKAEHMKQAHGHCSPEHVDAFVANATCMLMANHDGEHEWVSDDRIGVTFHDEGDAP